MGFGVWEKSHGACFKSRFHGSFAREFNSASSRALASELLKILWKRVLLIVTFAGEEIIHSHASKNKR